MKSRSLLAFAAGFYFAHLGDGPLTWVAFAALAGFVVLDHAIGDRW